jgi:hypothetical protein
MVQLAAAASWASSVVFVEQGVGLKGPQNQPMQQVN